MWIRRKRTQSGRKVKNMNLEDSIVSTISDAKPMMILALCTIVLFVIVASLIEAWLAKARKAKSEVDTLPSGPEASQRSVEKSEAVEQAVDNAGGFDLDERRKARAPESIPDRRPWFFKTVMGRGLVCLLTKVIPILLPVVWFSLVVMGMLPNPLALAEPAGAIRLLHGPAAVVIESSQWMLLAASGHVHRRRPARFTARPAAKARLDDG